MIENMEIKNSNNFSQDDDLNIKYLVNFLFRNKIAILTTCLLFFIVSLIYSLQKRKTWEGKFEIVLDIKKENALNSNSFLANTLIAIDPSSNSISTEIGILESQSVLMPIFNYVEKEKKKNNPKIFLNFDDWKTKNLSIKLRKKTTILDISYKDNDKNLILPVLRKVSSTYQKYSNESKKKELKLSEKFLKNQISLYKTKSSESLKEVQEFEIDQDLQILNIGSKSANNNSKKMLAQYSSQLSQLPLTLGNQRSTESIITQNTDIESARVNAANRIKTIKLQIKKINENSDDDKLITYLSSNIPELTTGDLYKGLDEIDSKLIILNSKYNSEDPSIKVFEEQKKYLLKLIKERSISYLNSEKIIQEAIKEAATRPKGVLLKYKELIREASRDELTLIELEDQLRSIQLEISRIDDPWQLISNPEVKKFPIAPNKKLIVFIGTLFGFFIGSTIFYFKEKKDDLIFEIDDFRKSFALHFIEKYNLEKKNFTYYSKTIISEDILNPSIRNKLIFIKTGSVSDSDCNELIKDIFGEESKFKLCKTFNQIKDDSNIVLINSLGKVSFTDIKSLKTRLELYQKTLFGIFFID